MFFILPYRFIIILLFVWCFAEIIEYRTPESDLHSSIPYARDREYDGKLRLWVSCDILEPPFSRPIDRERIIRDFTRPREPNTIALAGIVSRSRNAEICPCRLSRLLIKMASGEKFSYSWASTITLCIYC